MLGRSIPIGGSENYDTLFSDIAPLQGVLAVEQPGYLDGERDVGGRSLELLLTPFDQERLGGVLVVIHDVSSARPRSSAGSLWPTCPTSCALP